MYADTDTIRAPILLLLLKSSGALIIAAVCNQMLIVCSSTNGVRLLPFVIRSVSKGRDR